MTLRPVPAPERARLDGLIAELLSASPQAVPGVGHLPAITVDLTQ